MWGQWLSCGNRKTLTLEAGLAPTKEVEETQPGRDVRVNTLWYVHAYVRDGNIDGDGD